MYPAINITAQGGLNAFKESNWFNVPGSLFGIIGGTIAQPILNGKQLKTRYRQAQVASEEAEINFRQAILGAVGEVSNALVQIEKLDEQQEVAEGLVATATKAVENSLTLYRYDGATYIEVILAQSNKLQAELELASLKTQKLGAITALYRSLGGGWQ
ncbi:TolC family protein [Sphingobacterium daejeonense]|uniref:TolC family protein n=1 Tax=Sphingobacterium daejeonense TaxID=371142 RepID=UPI0010C4A2EF|nr:TolC family protein [Sphingobacterium daejeonense]VTP91672.1 Cation efflux system protein CusC precursor [Sphingobacterium daejeonense]